uniref:Uncharacterized protein n=1 Tax=Vespula pensylvanica TaxID=30213 RepID=A0A834KQ08_VESPE|nr:hypothetical protein H0235_013299 [Vespula pensylvanica]
MNLAKGRRIGNSSDGEVELNIAIVERDGRRKRDCNGLNESDKTARTGKLLVENALRAIRSRPAGSVGFSIIHGGIPNERSYKLEFIRSASSNLTPVLTKLTATVAVQQPSKSYSDSVVELIKQPVGRPAALAVTPSFSFAGYTLALKRSSTEPSRGELARPRDSFLTVDVHEAEEEKGRRIIRRRDKDRQGGKGYEQRAGARLF